MEVKEDLLWYVKEQKSQNHHFAPYANFNCPYLKIGLCDLFPLLLECITYADRYHIWISDF